MVRFATIGTNFITDRFIQAGQLCEDFQLSAVYSRSISTAKEFAAKYNVQKTYYNLEDLAQDKDIDAVYIGSPTSCHASQAVQMLKAGKHVLCEKPIASNVKETEAIIEAAAQSNTVVLEAMRSVFMPGFKAIEDNLHKLGKIRRVVFNFCQYSSRYDNFKKGIAENAFNLAYSNGAIMDIGVYCLYAMVRLFGMPKKINADAVILSSGIDGAGTVIASYKDFQAVIPYSKITNSCNSSEIQGEDACMVIDKMGEPENIKIVYRSGKEEAYRHELSNYGMQYEIQEFMRLIKSGESIEKYNENSLMTIKIIDEARRIMGIRFPADMD